MPSDQTSAARGLYIGATLFLHSVEVRQRSSIDLFSYSGEIRTITHVRRAAAVHVGRLDIGSGQSEIGELNDNFTFSAAIRRC